MDYGHEIVPAQLAVKAMRDNGYKNAAYAIAELVDNAVQAGASKVQILLGERTTFISERKSIRVEEICILDDGAGMNKELLKAALQFGNGSHLAAEQQKGIGKFGMGLPSSSISQCRRVDVYSWQDGLDSTISTFLDLTKIEKGEQKTIQAPQDTNIPPNLTDIHHAYFGDTGTLIRWRQLDRLMWKTASAIINNSEFLIGRMYRHFIAAGSISIEFVVYDIDDPKSEIGKVKKAKVNDPTYLLVNATHGGIFDKYGEKTFNIKYKNQVHQVKVLFSMINKDYRKKDLSGAKDYGKHAARNVGVSIVRAKRELELEESWVNKYDSRSRWWGAEVQFDPGLDEVFGVSNNKQHAAYLTKTEISDSDSRLKHHSSVALRLDMEEAADPALIHQVISDYISDNVSAMMKAIARMGKGKRGAEDGSKRYTQTDEAIGSKVIRQRQKDGKIGASDEGEEMPASSRKKVLEQVLKSEAGYSDQEATDFSAELIDSGIKIFIEKKEFGSGIFFDIQKLAGELIVWLNTNHPAFPKLIEALEEGGSSGNEEEDLEAVKERLTIARSGLRLLLMAWARYEDELKPDEQEKAEDTRVDWGRMARSFLKES